MRRLFVISCLLMASYHLFAQKSDYSMERISWINPWIATSNASGMALNEQFLSEIKSFTEGDISGYYQAGSLKNIYDPATTLGGNFGIGSYMKLGKTYLKGAFEYDYSHSTKSTWRGWQDPYSTPFMAADSIPGNLSFEQYKMGASIAYPALGNRLSLGLDLKYNVGIMAKHKDLRNKNTLMKFEAYPSAMYSGDDFRIGLTLGYNRETESVEYRQEDSSNEKYLFNLYGLWLYYSTGFSSAETSRRNITSGYSGSVTLDFDLAEVRLFNDFTGKYTTALQTETGYNNLTHGQTNTLTFSDALTLLYGYKHKIDINVRFYTMVGNRFLQRQELDPQSNIRVWVTYGGPINYYYRQFSSEEISYTFRKAKSYTDIKWETTLAFKGSTVSHKYKETPLLFSQSLSTIEGYLKHTRHISFQGSRLDIAPQVGYSLSDGLANDIALGQNQWQLEKKLLEEYNFWYAPKVKYGIGVKYNFKNLSVKGEYLGAAATSGALKGEMRHQGSLSLGFVF